MDYPKYRKFLVAGLGAALIVASQIAGVTVAEDVDDNVLRIFDSVVAILTAFGVKRASNDPS
jgi:uncharacterized membrane protein